MATSLNTGGWNSILNEHPIFRKLRSSRRVEHNESKQICVIHDGEIFVWNRSTASILTTNLKSLASEYETTSSSSKGSNSHESFQTLLCTRPPVHEVQKIVFSQSGNFLCLVSKRSISVLELPRRWGKQAKFEGGKEKISCRTLVIGERFLTCNSKVQVLHVDWHPGSPSDTHIAVLTSDSIFRIFNILNGDVPEQIFHVGSDDGSSDLSSSFSTMAALGNQAVGFDFGPPIELDNLTTAAQDSEEKTLVWPVYILWESGEVFYVLTAVGLQRPAIPKKVHGPLNMFPADEDNYGTDACAILCLKTQPPVLNIALPTGKIYHCLVLERDEDADDTRSELSWRGQARTSKFDKLIDPSLYVVERVELELSLTTVDLDSDQPTVNDFSCPITMHHDPVFPERYHCSHSAGVHSIILSWMDKVQQYCETDEGISSDLGSKLDEAVVEHLICTKPLPSSPTAPILGLTITTEKLLSPTLLCLTSSFDVITLPLRLTHHSHQPSLLSDGAHSVVESPLRKLNREPFEEHIKQLLKKSSSNPLLSTRPNTEISPQECFQLLSRTTQVFREEYMQRLDLAREAIEHRLDILRDQKEQQEADLRLCKDARSSLTEGAQNIAERYQDIHDAQVQLTNRFEGVLRNLQAQLPSLSDAEFNMQQELKDIQHKLDLSKNGIEELRIKQKYQSDQMDALKKKGKDNYSPKSPAMNSNSPSFSKNQTENIRCVLKNEGDQIAQLVNQVNNIKLQMHV